MNAIINSLKSLFIQPTIYNHREIVFMKFTSVQIKQIIKEEVSKVLQEQLSAGDEEILNVMTKKAKNEIATPEWREYRPYRIFDKDIEHRVQAKFLKKPTSHVEGILYDAFSGAGVKFEAVYDVSSSNYEVKIHDVAKVGPQPKKVFIETVKEYLKNNKLDPNFQKWETSGQYKTYHGDKDWEGGESDPTKTSVKDVFGQGPKNVRVKAVPYGYDKWRV